MKERVGYEKLIIIIIIIIIIMCNC